jgi:hypothetical protein
MMSPSGPLGQGIPVDPEITPPQANAILFHQLARFLVWGREHTDVASAYPDFGLLLESATFVLTRVGRLEDPGSSACQDLSPHDGPNSEILAPDPRAEAGSPV